MTEPLIKVENLIVGFPSQTGHTNVVKGVSFDLAPGETLGMVGESGSGKTTIGRAILGLAPIRGGKISFRGQVISDLGRSARRRIAKDIQAVFQDPYSSLNPAMTVESILVEPLAAAGVEGGSARVRELLDAVGLPSDAGSRYPREFSGGQRQRIAIARALALRPSVIVCDEPTSALDVSTQATVLKLFKDLQEATGVAYIFISHDLGVVNSVSDRIAVLYQGEIIEIGEAAQVSAAPNHPYTKRLQLAAPIADPKRQRARRLQRLAFSQDGSVSLPYPSQG